MRKHPRSFFSLCSSYRVLLALVVCAAQMAARQSQSTNQTPKPVAEFSDIQSYEGQNVASVELAGRAGVTVEQFQSAMTQRPNAPLSFARIDETIAALKQAGSFEDVQLEVRPELNGLRVIFVLQPALYFGLYTFIGADEFAYSRLLQAANYNAKTPYNPGDVRRS